MADEMTPEREQEIRSRRLDEVTAGPWLVADGEDGRPVIYTEGDGSTPGRLLLAAVGASEADVQFVASARRSVPELLAELDRLRNLTGSYQRNQERQAAENGALEERARALQEENAELTAHVDFRMQDIERLRARVAELEVLTPAAIQTCRVCGAGYDLGQPCSTCEFQAQLADAVADLPEAPRG
ncbi:hypothetical protein [Streptomyces lavendulae]|uniref:hypothetical protein n=1 Tax=Streptomyces lavendulae TaxID=1914 RepID=UPI0031EF46C8